MPLTAAQYKTEVENARNKFNATDTANFADRAQAWAQICSVYALLFNHQDMFDKNAAIIPADALTYRTRAEDHLNNAKARANSIASVPLSMNASAMAGDMAYMYTQMVKVANGDG